MQCQGRRDIRVRGRDTHKKTTLQSLLVFIRVLSAQCGIRTMINRPTTTKKAATLGDVS